MGRFHHITEPGPEVGTPGMYTLAQQGRTAFSRPDHPEQGADDRRPAGPLQANKPVNLAPPHPQQKVVYDLTPLHRFVSPLVSMAMSMAFVRGRPVKCGSFEGPFSVFIRKTLLGQSISYPLSRYRSNPLVRPVCCHTVDLIGNVFNNAFFVIRDRGNGVG